MASWHQILIFGGELTRFSMFFPQLQLSEAWNLAWPPEARRSSWRGLKDFVQALLGDGWDGMEKLVEKPGFLEEKLRKRVPLNQQNDRMVPMKSIARQSSENGTPHFRAMIGNMMTTYWISGVISPFSYRALYEADRTSPVINLEICSIISSFGGDTFYWRSMSSVKN